MFIQMSNELFLKDYAGQKIKVLSNDKNEIKEDENQQ